MSVQALSAQPFSRHMQILTDETQPDVVEAESPEAARRNHNYEVLRRIQGGLTELEGAISRLDSLIAESTRLATEVQKVAQQEAELLRDESLSEATATKRLIEIRARADVLGTRAKAAAEPVQEQQNPVLDLGAVIRRTLARAANEILMARQARIQRLLDDLLGVQFDSGLPISNDSSCLPGELPSSAALPPRGRFIGEEWSTGNTSWIWMTPAGANFPSWVDP